VELRIKFQEVKHYKIKKKEANLICLLFIIDIFD